MRFLVLFAALLGGSMAAPPSSIATASKNVKVGMPYTECHPGSIKDIVITKFNTLNGTKLEHKPPTPGSTKPTIANTTAAHGNLTTRGAAAVRPLPIKLVNNIGGNLKAYVTGKDEAGRVLFIRQDGSIYYPDPGSSTTPVPIDNVAINMGQGETTINLPFSLSSGRVYFAKSDLKFFVVHAGDGTGIVQPSVTDKADQNADVTWGFVELTYTADGVIWANISFVDFVGLPFGMTVKTLGGATHTVKGLPKDAIRSICSDLEAQQQKDGQPWARMCMADKDHNPVRVLSPNMYRFIEQGAFRNYWTSYVDQVWSTYASRPLRIDTQTGSGVVNCQVRGSEMQCDGDNRGYAKPSAEDIWTCDGGPFHIQGGDNGVHYAVVPRLCAAFVRTTLLLAGGDSQPGLADQYYKNDPTSHYSRVIHARETDGRGYAFPYDDVSPSGGSDRSGLIAANDPETLTFFVGGI